MTNGKASTIVFLAFAFLVLAQLTLVINMTQPQPQQQNIPSAKDGWRKDAYMVIAWRTPMLDGMSPREVLASTVARMQYEQTTLLGSDRNAQALVKAMEALAILEGRSTETADGFPIIE